MDEEKNSQGDGDEIIVDHGQAEEIKQEPESTEKVKRPKKPADKKQLLILILFLVVVISIIAAVMYFVFGVGKSTPSDFDANVTAVEKIKKVAVVKVPGDQQLERFIKPTTGEKWLAKTKKVANLGYYVYDDGSHAKTNYYEVGSRGKNTIYMSVTQSGPGEVSYLYEKSPEGKVSVITQWDSFYKNYDNTEFYNSPTADEFKKDIVLDTKTKYDSLSLPETFDVGSGEKAGREKQYQPFFGSLDNRYDTANLPAQDIIKNLGGSSLIKATTTYVDTGLSAIGYIVKLPIGTTVGLNYSPLPESLKGYKWDSGSDPKGDNIYAVARGCSQNPSSITRSDTLSDVDIMKIGKTSDGKVIYQLKDINSTLANKAYKEFKDMVKSSGTPDMPYKNISKEDFVHKEHGIVVYKDAFGQILVYVRSQLMLGGGCAKPVIYLYPTTDTLVDVKVGANVTVSEPYYNPKSGWKNVQARPNGDLTYNGNKYDSLFWEGYGFGAYPSIKSGTVVKSVDAARVIKQQLGALGLNKKESDDFLEYWLPKLPKEKYTVMSWITTKDMNNLAPLYISPKPDTTIRVFLDFWGSDNPVSIPEQKLSSITRKGFTVVEWGGLTNGILK